MRRNVLSMSLPILVLLAGCQEPSGDEDGSGPRVSDALRGEVVDRLEEGGWTIRRTPSAAQPGALSRRSVRSVTAKSPAPGGSVLLAEKAEPESDSAVDVAPRMRPGGNPQPAAPALRAGATDDNADFAAFVQFLDAWSGKARRDSLDWLDVRERRHVRVVGADDRPVPGARVVIADIDRDVVVWRGTTYGDGRVPFFPNVVASELDAATGEQAPALAVEVHHGDRSPRQPWDARGDLEVKLPVSASTAPIQLDVAFVIDTTGSMGDEIARIKQSLRGVTQQLRSLEREFDLRYGAVLYRDLGDEYVTKAYPFTAEIDRFDTALQNVQANGGGDGPESLNQGLAVAVHEMAWRGGAAKVMFLIADAPPHMDYAGDVTYGRSLRAAVASGIRVHAVAASGLDRVGTVVFRQIAQFTRGKFIFIEYGTTAASAAQHGVAGKVKSNNLDDIIFEQIRDEVARWGRP